MRRLKDRNHVAVTPKIWTTESGHKIAWNSVTEPFHTFIAKINAYYQANGKPAPTLEVVEDTICRQLAAFWCTGDAPQTTSTPIQRSRGCSSCGKRK